MGPIVIPNRVVMAPMRTNMASRKGCPSEALWEFLSLRAQGGAGLMISESISVKPHDGSPPKTLKLFAESHLPPLTNLVDQLHEYRCMVAAQLWHPGPRTGNTRLAVSPSGTVAGFPAARSASIAEIRNIISNFVRAACLAARAGFDAVEIHAAHGYLLHHFIDGTTNQRTDRYGGTLERRYRILSEILRGIRDRVPHFPLLIRLSLKCDDDFPGIAGILQEIGFDAVDLRTGFSSHPPRLVNMPGYTLDLARKLRPHLAIPLMTGGHITSPRQAKQALNEVGVDGIVLGRALVADARWPNKTFMKQQVKLCRYDCQPSCYDRVKAGKQLQCRVL